jgi:hypothetical protein
MYSSTDDPYIRSVYCIIRSRRITVAHNDYLYNISLTGSAEGLLRVGPDMSTRNDVDPVRKCSAAARSNGKTGNQRDDANATDGQSVML